MVPLLSIMMGQKSSKSKKSQIHNNGATPQKKVSTNEQKLLWQIREKKYAQVIQLLPKIKTTEYTDNYNVFTALQLAVLLGRYSLVKTLLDLGANPETRGFQGRVLTPLQLAAKYGHSDIVHLLANWGACVNGIEGTDPPIHTAAYNGQLQVFNTFLSLEADTSLKNIKNGTLLHSACAGSWHTTDSTSFPSFDNSYSTQSMSNQHEEIVQKLVQLGAEVDTTDSDGCTPLHVAIERGNIKVIKALVECGARFNVTTDDGDTFLHRAVLSRFFQKEDLEYTLSVCATRMKNDGTEAFRTFVNQRNSLGYTALHNAVQVNNHAAVKCLLSYGADASIMLRKLNNAKSWRIKSALTPVQLACVLGNYEALDALKPFTCDDWADTKEGRLGVIALTWSNLIDAYKAEKTSKISLGWYQYREEEIFIKIATVLAPKATDINYYLPGLKVKRTLLHFSVFKKRKLLLSSICENPHVNLEILNGYGKTALQASLAKKNVQFLDLSEILVQNGANIHVQIDTDKILRTVLMKAIELGSTRLVRQILIAGVHVDEQMICKENKKSLFQSNVNFKSSIIQLLLLADYRLSLLHSTYCKRSIQNTTQSIKEMLEMRQTTVFSLKQLTRKVIRNQLFHSKHIESLPLPRIIKNYLYIPELKEFRF